MLSRASGPIRLQSCGFAPLRAAVDVKFAVRYPGGAVHEIVIDGGVAVVGRDPSCDLVLNDPKSSRRHAVVESGPDGLVIRDTGSANGISVNGKKTERSRAEGGRRLPHRRRRGDHPRRARGGNAGHGRARARTRWAAARRPARPPCRRSTASRRRPAAPRCPRAPRAGDVRGPSTAVGPRRDGAPRRGLEAGGAAAHRLRARRVVGAEHPLPRRHRRRARAVAAGLGGMAIAGLSRRCSRSSPASWPSASGPPGAGRARPRSRWPRWAS